VRTFHSAGSPPVNFPFSQARLLLAGLPPRQEALAAQKANLQRFVDANRAAFDALPCYPFTRERAWPKAPKTRVAASSLPGCIGLQGVFMEQSMPAHSKSQRLLHYPGLLMTEELYRKFQQQYHCPTALQLPAFQECDLMIVGDPTAAGAIVNDGVKSGKERTFHIIFSCAARAVRFILIAHLCFVARVCAANCRLLSVSKENLPFIKKMSKDGKYHVSAEVAAVWTLPDVPLACGAELLLDYGGKDFWDPSFVALEHCAVCFSRDDTDAHNPVVQCEGKLPDGTMCRVSRHRHCFRPSNKPTLAEIADTNIRYFCPDHYAQSASDAATPHAYAVHSASAAAAPRCC
jgi:hypothetical protein